MPKLTSKQAKKILNHLDSEDVGYDLFVSQYDYFQEKYKCPEFQEKHRQYVLARKLVDATKQSLQTFLNESYDE